MEITLSWIGNCDFGWAGRSVSFGQRLAMVKTSLSALMSSRVIASCKHRLVFGLLAGWVWLVCLPAVAMAATIQIQPTFQTITISDQKTVTGEIKLTNSSQTDQTFQVFATDIQQFDSDGKVILADRPLTGNDYALASYVKITPSQWVLPAQKTTSIPFTILNTQDLSPGGHYAAVVARLAANQQLDQQQILPALSSFILVRKIGGEKFHLSLSAVDISHRSWFWQMPSKAMLTFTNQGNVHVVPHGVMEFKNAFGQVTYQGIINEDSLYVLPGTQREIPVRIKLVTDRWSSWWPVMLYTLTITGQAEPGSVPFSQSNTLLIIQPWLVVMMGGGLVSASLFYWKRRFYRHPQHTAHQGP